MANVLWIEDGAQFELAHLAGPVYIDGRFNVHVAANVTDGLQLLYRREYDAIILDIRLPPGEDKVWDVLYKQAGRHKSTAALGLKFLKSILGTSNAEYQLQQPVKWLTPKLIGVFTVERSLDLRAALEELGITVFRQKTADMPETVLLEMVQQICGVE